MDQRFVLLFMGDFLAAFEQRHGQDRIHGRQRRRIRREFLDEDQRLA